MKFCFIGEAMIEVSNGPNGCKLGFAGDTLNTAIHLARFGYEVSYLTEIGDDQFSQDFIELLGAENINGSFITKNAKRHMGLYTIRVDDKGERSFQYWRDNSAAKQMFENIELAQMAQKLSGFDYICFSLISLAILPDAGREFLLSFCAKAQANGAKIVFDGNYRPKLWANAQEAANYRDKAIAICDIGLPTFEDEFAISGFQSIEECAEHWRSFGAIELVVKDGVNGCLIGADCKVLPPAALKPIDTSGAGDAFNGGYLSARAAGYSIEQSAIAGHKLAGWAILNCGAIPAINNDAPY